MKNRWLAKLHANTLGYFWLPCPICGQMFGGQEVDVHKENSFAMTSWSGGKCVCPDCRSNGKAEEYNQKWMIENPHS